MADPAAAPQPSIPWSGAVLCGGRSRRMGRDKALIEIDGVPMARRVADALTAAGASEVVAVGGDAAALAALGLAVVPDELVLPTSAKAGPAPGDRRSESDAGSGRPAARGEEVSPGRSGAGRVGATGVPSPGPLVGIVTALRTLPTEVVLVVACDLVAPSAEAMAATVRALAAEPAHDLAVPHDGDGVPQWLHAAWRRAVWERLRERLGTGERSIHRAVTAARLRAVTVRGMPAGVLTDADVPAHLPRHAD